MTRLAILILALAFLLGAGAFAAEPPTCSIATNSAPSLLTLIRVQLSLWLDIDLYGSGPQLNDGRHARNGSDVSLNDAGDVTKDVRLGPTSQIKDFVPIRDIGGDSKDDVRRHTSQIKDYVPMRDAGWEEQRSVRHSDEIKDYVPIDWDDGFEAQ